VEHVAYTGEMRNAYKVLVGKYDGKKTSECGNKSSGLSKRSG
jgi:hypothetical protein